MTFKEFCKELLEEYKWASFQYDSVISFTQTFSEVYTSYLDCLEAGIIRALNII